MKKESIASVLLGMLILAGCTNEEGGTPPVTQPVGTGTYQPVASRQFYPPYFIGPFSYYGIFNVYSTKESFEYYYHYHPEAERVDPSEHSIILASARQTQSDWNIYGQGFYKTDRNRYLLVAHLYPNSCKTWSMSALVPKLPSDAEIGLLELMHPNTNEVSSLQGSYELYNVKTYPTPDDNWDELVIIRTQDKFNKYYSGRTDLPGIDFDECTLILGTWAGGAPDRQSFQFARTSTGAYNLSANLYHDPNSTYDSQLIDRFCVLVPAIPEDATVGILTTNYWIDGSPIHYYPTDLAYKEYELPASFEFSKDIPDDLLVLRTQEDFDRYFSGYPDAAAVKFDWYTLLIARGHTTSTVDKVEHLYYDTEDNRYEYAVSVTLRDDTNPDTWYTALLVSKLDAGVVPKLTVEYKQK